MARASNSVEYPPPALTSSAVMPGVIARKARMSAGWRRLSLVRSAAVRSGLATIALICSGVSVCAAAPPLKANASRMVRPSLMVISPQARECPAGGVTHQRRFVVQQLLNSRDGVGAGAIAQGIGDIANESVAADALDGGAGEALAERCVVERRELGQRRRGQLLTGGEGRFAGVLRELVPWTGGKAIVAAIDAVAEQRSQRLVDRALVLDG